MSKEEQFEHIENKIRQAIEDNPPAFNEKAWVKMEALLDKEEKKRRPFFWWFLLPLLIAGGAYVFYSHNNNKLANAPKDISSSSDIKQSLKEVEHSTPGEAQNNTVENILPGNQNKSNNSASSSSNKPGSDNLEEANNKRNENVTVDVAGNADNKNIAHNNSKIIINKKGKKKVMVTDNSPVDDATMPGVHENDQATGADLKENTIPELAEVKKESQDSGLVAISNKQKTATNANTAKKNVSAHTQKKSSHIYFLASVGPDIGSVKLFSFNNSSVTPKYGLGAGYQFNKKFSLQTGFYAGKKKYIAGPDDYHTKYPLPYNVKIIKVDANCLVYEIPVTLRYDVIRKPSISYFGTIGLSSYLMKSEYYNIYRTVNTWPGYFDTAYFGNKHLFSNLSFSAGVEKKISKSLSLLMEPSVSIPLSGVGYGKVKLFSTAIMLGVKYYPFKK